MRATTKRLIVATIRQARVRLEPATSGLTISAIQAPHWDCVKNINSPHKFDQARLQF